MLCSSAVLCECCICMYTPCVRWCIFLYSLYNVQCACTRTLFNRSTYNVQCSHSIISSQAIIVSHLICAALFCCSAGRKSNVLAQKRVVVWTKRNKTIKWSSNVSVSDSYLNVIIASPLHIDTFFPLASKQEDSKMLQQQCARKKKTTTTKENEKDVCFSQHWHENAHFTCTITRACKEKRKD